MKNIAYPILNCCPLLYFIMFLLLVKKSPHTLKINRYIKFLCINKKYQDITKLYKQGGIDNEMD